MRLAICAGQWLFASVLAAAFDGEGHEVVVTTDNPRHLVDEAEQFRPDLCLVDAPGTAALLRDLDPAPLVVLLAEAQDEEAWDAYDRGTAEAVVSKACGLRTLVAAVEAVASGNHLAEGRPHAGRRRRQCIVEALTTRELEVLRFVVRGYSTEQMAAELGVSRHTVRTHVQQVLRKLGVHGRGKIARAAAAAGLVDVQELVQDGKT